MLKCQWTEKDKLYKQHKKAGGATLISDKVDFMAESIVRDKTHETNTDKGGNREFHNDSWRF